MFISENTKAKKIVPFRKLKETINNNNYIQSLLIQNFTF